MGLQPHISVPIPTAKLLLFHPQMRQKPSSLGSDYTSPEALEVGLGWSLLAPHPHPSQTCLVWLHGEWGEGRRDALDPEETPKAIQPSEELSETQCLQTCQVKQRKRPTVPLPSSH